MYLHSPVREGRAPAPCASRTLGTEPPGRPRSVNANVLIGMVIMFYVIVAGFLSLYWRTVS